LSIPGYIAVSQTIRFSLLWIFFTEQGRQPCVQLQAWRSRSLYLCSPLTWWPKYIPRHRFTIRLFLRLQGFGGGILICLHTALPWLWNCDQSKGYDIGGVCSTFEKWEE
jgi:hypothetical protein